MNTRFILGMVATTVLATPASAAFIAIDDSDVDTVTITAGDFEDGFFVDGVLLTSGLSSSNSITLADGGFTISGSWVDLGEASGSRVDILFALPGDLGVTTSGIEFGATSDGVFATLNGSFGAYINLVTYFSTALPTLLQNGQTGIAEIPFLSVSFISESLETVPEPAALALFGLGLVGIGLRRRTRA